MRGSGFLQDLLASIVERRPLFSGADDDRPIEELCFELMSSRGEVSGNRIAAAILDRYQHLDDADRISFFHFLTEEMDLDASAVETLARDYQQEPSGENLKLLVTAAEPPRQELLRRLNQVPAATELLVSMRRDLLALLDDHPSLKRLDLDFAHLFASWFNRGFLVLRPINWETPANILAKVIQYEAVHAINDWDDLRRRLQPTDRRCFAFFHPVMPNEPLVFVEVALCQGIPSSIQALLSEDREPLAAESADTAAFYSISNCQQGLRGISFGNSLIKQVAVDLARQMPQLKTFVTLSPLPGFARWLQTIPEATTVSDISGLENENSAEIAKRSEDLRSLAARYLLNEKRSDGSPLDPVARFHLGNGASIHDIHAMADISPKGMAQSAGVMVNYMYDLSRVEKFHESFADNGEIAASRDVKNLAVAKLSLSPIVDEGNAEA